MHVALTDVLTCPRCGPGHGLILLPEEVRERRAVSGVLGCATCLERYPIHGGVADLSAGEPLGDAGPGPGERERAVRLAALLGLADAGGVVVLIGPAGAQASELASLLEGVEVVAVRSAPAPGASVIRTRAALPFQTASLRGVALTGDVADLLLEEGARVLAVGARLLLDPAPADARARVAAAGLRLVAAEGTALVAVR